jgi:tetratricopeptide (TPR) repeat protein
MHACHEFGDLDGAIDACRSALEHNSGNPFYSTLLGNAFGNKKQYEAAIKAYQSVFGKYRRNSRSLRRVNAIHGPRSVKVHAYAVHRILEQLAGSSRPFDDE